MCSETTRSPENQVETEREVTSEQALLRWVRSQRMDTMLLAVEMALQANQGKVAVVAAQASEPTPASAQPVGLEEWEAAAEIREPVELVAARQLRC